jgi:hypothetical protein
MLRSKKFIFIALLAIIVLAGTIGGVVLAQTDEEESQPVTLLDRVTTILNDQGVVITSDQLKDAFTQAGNDIRNEALDKRLQDLVDQGTITDQQAQDYKAWLESRPDVPFQFGLRNEGGMKLFGGFDRHGFGFHGGCEPSEPTE